jgi:hypothetical protein
MRALAERVESDGRGANIGVGEDEVTEDEVTEDELTALALAADPDTPVGDDAVCLTDHLGGDAGRLLPEWYMPGVAGAYRLTAWRRSVALVIVAAFLLITAYGLCNTYGDMVLRGRG